MDGTGVPVVTIDEDGDPIFRKDEVRSTTGSDLSMKPESSP
jgi:hypothetical protein